MAGEEGGGVSGVIKHSNTFSARSSTPRRAAGEDGQTDGGRRRQRRSTRFAGATTRPRPRIAGRPSPRMEADTRGSSQPRPVIHGSAAERAELAGAATPLQSTAASTPVRAALLSDDSPGGGSPSLRRSLSTRPSFLPSLRRNFAPRRWNSFVQIKSAAWKYHARPLARQPRGI